MSQPAQPTKCPGPCSLCGEEAEDRCEQLTGPCCHKSLTFEECVSASAARAEKLFAEMDREQGGKTTLPLVVSTNAQQQGGAVAYVDSEHPLDPAYVRKMTPDPEDRP